MRPHALSTLVLAILLIVFGAPASAHAQAGTITGRVSLTTPKGEVVYGDWVRVYLTSEPAEVPAVDLNSAMKPWERRDRLNSVHMDFFVNFRDKQNDAGYAVDDKLCRPDGTFTFSGLPAGRYYVVVTFPSMIAGFKCAWQAEVDLVEGKSVHVELNAENLALPSY